MSKTSILFHLNYLWTEIQNMKLVPQISLNQFTRKFNFIEKNKIEKLIDNFTFNVTHLEMYVLLFRQFIDTVGKWLDLTNGTFILDTYHNFEFKTTHNSKLPGKSGFGASLTGF